MGYCPACGAEYLEGVEECADCGLPLVDEPPELEEGPSFLDRVTAAWVLRGVFLALIVSAVAYAFIGIATMLFFVFSDDSPYEGGFNLIHDLNEVQTSLFGIAVASIAILGGALLIRRYEEPNTFRLRPSTVALRILFWIVVIFSAIWAVTGIATSRLQTDQSLGLQNVGEGEEPSESDVTLLMLHYAAYIGGTTAFAIMVALFMLGQAKRDPSEDTTLDGPI